MRSHSDGVRSDVYRIPMLIGESESLYNCKMHDLSSFSRRSHFLNRLLEHELTPTLRTRANDPRHVELVREHCRESVAEFVKDWLITRAQWTNRFDSIVVVFPDERTFKSDKELEDYDGKPIIHIKK